MSHFARFAWVLTPALVIAVSTASAKQDPPSTGPAKPVAGQHQGPAGPPPTSTKNQQAAPQGKSSASDNSAQQDPEFYDVLVAWSAVVQAVSAVAVLVLSGVLLRYSHLGWKAAEAESAANDRLNKILNQQWVDVSEWRCVEVQIPPQLTSHLALSFVVTNNTPRPLMLVKVRVYCNHEPLDDQWINHKLGPTMRRHVHGAVTLTREQSIAHVQAGTTIQVVGCAYFIDVFGDEATSLFARYVHRRNGKTSTSAHDRDIISLWDTLESRRKDSNGADQGQS